MNPNGVEVTICKLEYGTTEKSYGSSALCSRTPGRGATRKRSLASITGLASNTTYHFRVVATNAAGTSYSKGRTFKTLAAAPTVVTGGASAITQTSATLSATVNPNGVEVSACKLDYGTTEFLRVQ